MIRRAPIRVPYFREPQLSPKDQRDLDAYYAMLRSYFEVPDDQPLFPPATDVEKPHSMGKPSRTACNRADHPWRRKQTGGRS